MRRIMIMVGVLGVVTLVVVSAVWGFRGYEGKLEAEREQLGQEIAGLGVARDAADWKCCESRRNRAMARAKGKALPCESALRNGAGYRI